MLLSFFTFPFYVFILYLYSFICMFALFGVSLWLRYRCHCLCHSCIVFFLSFSISVSLELLLEKKSPHHFPYNRLHDRSHSLFRFIYLLQFIQQNPVHSHTLYFNRSRPYFSLHFYFSCNVQGGFAFPFIHCTHFLFIPFSVNLFVLIFLLRSFNVCFDLSLK